MTLWVIRRCCSLSCRSQASYQFCYGRQDHPSFVRGVYLILEFSQNRLFSLRLSSNHLHVWIFEIGRNNRKGSLIVNALAKFKFAGWLVLGYGELLIQENACWQIWFTSSFSSLITLQIRSLWGSGRNSWLRKLESRVTLSTLIWHVSARTLWIVFAAFSGFFWTFRIGKKVEMLPLKSIHLTLNVIHVYQGLFLLIVLRRKNWITSCLLLCRFSRNLRLIHICIFTLASGFLRTNSFLCWDDPILKNFSTF